jgi:raffinose/stachyose/melibiose transport system permease protein
MKNVFKPGQIVMYAILLVLAVICLYPLYFSIISSLKDNAAIFMTPFSLPAQWRFGNYVFAWKQGHIGTYFFNSVFLTVVSVVSTAFFSIMGANVLARFEFKWNPLIYIFIGAGMMIPAQSTIIPLAYIFGKLGLTNNYLVMILLFTAFNIPMTVFILTGFMKSIPRELEEAAVIDGCSNWRGLFKIMVPMSAPAIASASIFNFILIWNNLLFPLMFLSKDSLKTLPIGLLNFYGFFTQEYAGTMAAINITIIPIMVVYILLQEKVEKGLTAGALKG